MQHFKPASQPSQTCITQYMFLVTRFESVLRLIRSLFTVMEPSIPFKVTVTTLRQALNLRLFGVYNYFKHGS